MTPIYSCKEECFVLDNENISAIMCHVTKTLNKNATSGQLMNHQSAFIIY